MGTFWLDAKSTISINRENGRTRFQERPVSYCSQELLACVPVSLDAQTSRARVLATGQVASVGP